MNASARRDWTIPTGITNLPRVITVSILFYAIFSIDVGWGQDGASERFSKETLVSRIDAAALVEESFSVSPDGKWVAYVVKSSDQQHVVVDGIGQDHFDEIAGFLWGIQFSPDSKRLAYYGRRGKDWFAVLDGREINGFQPVVYDAPIFSPDSRRVAYYAVSEGKCFVVVDGAEGKAYDKTGHPVFSPDSKRLCYRANSGGASFLVVQDREGPSYDFVQTPSFNAASTMVVYVASKSGKQCVVADGTEGKWYDRVYPSLWRYKVVSIGVGFISPDSFYYFALAGDRLLFVEERLARRSASAESACLNLAGK